MNETDYLQQAARWYMWKQYIGVGLAVALLLIFFGAYCIDQAQDFWRRWRKRKCS